MDNNKFPAISSSNSQISRSYIGGNEISNNEIGRDLNIGNTVVNLPTFNIGVGADALKALISQHEQLKDDSPEYLYVLEELQSKIKNAESRKIIGLEEKLNLANREIYLSGAMISSQKAAKMISRFQHTKSYQIIFNHILGLILTRFKSYVLPLIHEGVDDIVISSAINTTIIEPLYQEVALAGGYITSDVVEGMLYFLTEKCHVEWR